MSTLNHRVRPRKNRSTSPLIAMIADVLSTSFSYRMSEECLTLLERDVEFLAVLQWLVLHALKR